MRVPSNRSARFGRFAISRLLMVALAVSFSSPQLSTAFASPSDSLASKLDANKVVKRGPNVVLFFIDDLGYTDLNVYRSKLHDTPAFYETPVLDRLARQSCVFTDFYSAHPVCSPTRAALMSGKAPQRVGITQWISQPSEIHLPLDEVTIGEAFQMAGYETGYIGKWHLGEKDSQLPSNQGFGWTKGVNRAGQPASYFFPFMRKADARKAKRRGKYWDVPDLGDGNEGDYLTDRLTDQALTFIDSNQDKPFFLCFAHYAVHTPIQSPPELLQKYKQKRKRQFDGSKLTTFVDERNGATSKAIQNDAAYAAMLENLDHNVGRVLDKIEQLNLSDNTIVVFTSDNGGLTTLPKKRKAPTSVRPLRAGKGWNYEGGIRVPAMVRWPQQIQPSESETPAITMDLYPTLLDLAGIPQRPEQHVDGMSLISAIKGAPDSKLTKRFLAWHYPHHHGSGHTPSNAIREKNWKLIQHVQPQPSIELYDLDEDLSEKNDLADRFPEKAKALEAKLNQWLEETTKN